MPNKKLAIFQTMVRNLPSKILAILKKQLHFERKFRDIPNKSLAIFHTKD